MRRALSFADKGPGALAGTTSSLLGSSTDSRDKREERGIRVCRPL